MTAEVWKLGDPCPNCGPKGQVKFVMLSPSPCRKGGKR